jgi:type II secretory pathway pseudopilin PulG
MNQRGVTLIEAALAIALIGIIITPMIALYRAVQEEKKIEITRDRMNQIVSALSTYAESAGRIPCPSAPDSPDLTPPYAIIGTESVLGWEKGVTYADTVAGASVTKPIGTCTAAADDEGVVPFITLDLPYEVALDGWGNYFTYAVSPIFTQDNDASGGPGTEAATQVHKLCRTPVWVGALADDDSNPATPLVGDNKNAVRARFCCLAGNIAIPLATDINMYLAGAAPILANLLVADRGFVPLADWDDIGDPYLIGGVPSMVPLAQRNNIEVPAFVLISHGPDKAGAFRVNSTTNRTAGAAGYDAENADGDRDFYTSDRMTKRTGATHFDDIVVWMTQFGLMAYNGTASCSYP